MYQVTKECVMWPRLYGPALISETEMPQEVEGSQITQGWGILWWRQNKQGVGLRLRDLVEETQLVFRPRQKLSRGRVLSISSSLGEQALRPQKSSFHQETDPNSFIHIFFNSDVKDGMACAMLSAVDIKMFMCTVLASRGGTDLQTDNYDIKLPTVWQHDLMKRGFAKEGRGPSFNLGFDTCYGLCDLDFLSLFLHL